ncbi:DUF4157 domain-containing protein [Leptothermofonsia sichuanensis E412]|uniref:eCIS core domain-containing protein n=1 Tax=Leptothermofonsia sichuanensis TaxID=2917832 RepID=UPI001CA684FA|nr:DUF4157 domain-containing protein [Leptothermofonsia sichuanensis]QZZ18778.1 DUF4157 domain-containing protein [Leptothermofonsia sichuanensis E412]
MRSSAIKLVHYAAKQKDGERLRSPRTIPGVRSPSTGLNNSVILQRQCACGGGCPRCQNSVQTKLTINEPGDQYEQEADRIADEVMRIPESIIQRRVESRTLPEISPSFRAVLHSSGQPLDTETRAFMEPRFGHSFNHVYIHNNPQAHEMAGILNARAFTVGHDIVFGAGQYTPGTQEGQRLVAHELTHTIQQSTLSGETPFIQRQLLPPVPIIVQPSTAVVVNAVDARQERSTAWYLPWRYTGPITNFFRGDVTMTNIASMVANVITFLNGRRMHRLNIMDHGNQSGVEIGDDWLASADDVSRFAGTLGSLRSHFASGAIVHMQNCRAGQNRDLICALAATFGATVYAGTGLQNPLLGFNLGDYVNCNPTGTFNPNSGRPATPTPPPASTYA